MSSTAEQVQPLLEAKNLCGHYGRVAAIHDINLQVMPGELVAMVGANGAGKTTLLRALSGVHPQTTGQVTFDGQNITKWAGHKRAAAGMGHIPEGRQMFTALSVEENLILGGYHRRKESAEAQETLDWIYALFPILAEKRRDAAGSLSGGQQQMVAMGRALMGKPRLLLLDEPSMGLAPLLVAEILRVVVKLNQENRVTCLLVEQNARAALTIAHRAYVLETGRIAMEGAAEELLHDDAVRKAYLGH
uniref:Leucine/isoleucine/valine transporter subunit ATP-binding component of ABC superfamily n=1 Tax=Magnetococcus massalia (strain MO-1) TaxID=451514 RepID=A0A1S7LDZ8_MAGMO|nr:Leucine/isoleucine/valine transporter subunit; ATP-binding component of ABC superfamily [Candidatus Magnetococcus massalia]